MSRATISKSVSKGKYDPRRAAEFKDRANERRREIMLKAMEREAIRDHADHEPRKLIIIDELGLPSAKTMLVAFFFKSQFLIELI